MIGRSSHRPQSGAASRVPVPVTCWSACHPLSVAQGCCCLHSIQHALALGLHLAPGWMAVLTDPGTIPDRRGWHNQCLSRAETPWSPTHGRCVASDSLTSGFSPHCAVSSGRRGLCWIWLRIPSSQQGTGPPRDLCSGTGHVFCQNVSQIRGQIPGLVAERSTGHVVLASPCLAGLGLPQCSSLLEEPSRETCPRQSESIVVTGVEMASQVLP